MPKTIAVVKLAQGHVAFYDEITRLHLTLGNSTEKITEDMNLTNIKRAIANKVLILVTGSLSVDNKIKQNEENIENKNKSKKEVEKVIEVIESKEEAVESKENEVKNTETVENTEIDLKSKTTKKKKKKED